MLTVSIIIPCYNQGVYLSEAVDSIKNQTFQDWECIIVNDGSTDNTIQIAEFLCSRDCRIRLVNKENGGLSSARNAGLRVAKGKYLQFLDSDDYLLPTKLEKQIRQMESNESITLSVSKYHLCMDTINNTYDTRFSTTDYDLNIKGILYKWGACFTFPPACCMVRHEFLLKNNIQFNEDLKACEDWLFLVQTLVHGAKMKLVDEALVLYRQHSHQMTRDRSHMLNALIKVSFYIYDLLPESEKQRFMNQIPGTIFNCFESSIKIDLRRSNSTDYKIGNWILRPYRIIKKIWKKRK